MEVIAYHMGTQFIDLTVQSTLQALYNNMERTKPHRQRNYDSKHLDLLPENLTREQREEIGIETEEEDKEICVRHVLQMALQAIMIEKLRDAMEKDRDLGPTMKQKQEGTNSKKASKRPCGKIQEEIRETDGILIKGKQVVVPKTLHAQAITLAD